MEVFVRELEARNELGVPCYVIKAYILSLFFIVVVLCLAVGDAWMQYAELFRHSGAAFTSHHPSYSYLDFGFSP